MRISDWSSDVCSSDLQVITKAPGPTDDIVGIMKDTRTDVVVSYLPVGSEMATKWYVEQVLEAGCAFVNCIPVFIASQDYWRRRFRSEEHTSELQSLMSLSSAVFCLNKKKHQQNN